MTYARCSICAAPLDVPGRPWSLNCGGDCIACMAEAGDPSCVEAVAAMRVGEELVEAARNAIGFLVGSPPERHVLAAATAVVLLQFALPPKKEDRDA